MYITKPSYTAPVLNKQALISSTLEKKQYTILLIEDSETDRAIFQRYLGGFAPQQITFLEAEAGAAGLLLCQQQSPDLILLDYNLPDYDGLELLRRLKKQMHPAPPVLILTGAGDEQVAVTAMKLGARDYLVKGDLTKASLTQAIRRILSQQALQELMSQQARQQQLVSDVSLRISQEESLSDILNFTVAGARELLDCDRLIIYRFEPDLSGTVMAESLLPRWSTSLYNRIEDTCFKVEGVERYEQGYISAITDINDVEGPPCYLDMLRRFEVKANLVVPIQVNELRPGGEVSDQRVWGFLIAHHCRTPRVWHQDEVAFCKSLTVQMAIAIRQAELISYQAAHHKDLNAFARVVAHDLGAPLRAINNLASWLLEDIPDQLPAESQKQLKLIHSRAGQMNSIVTGLLNYSRSVRVGGQAVWVSLQSLLDKVIEDLALPPSFKIVTDVSTIPELHTHKLLLQQVLGNLISRTTKYQLKRHVTITAKDKGQMVLISVKDNGPDIDSGYHNSILEVFRSGSRQDSTENTEEVGLSIVKKVIERQGGQVIVCTTSTQGSTFTFTWPKQWVV